MSINNYDELYSEFLQLVAEAHNAHLAYKRKSTLDTRTRLRKALSDIRYKVVAIRAEIQNIQELRELEKNGHDTKPN
jgi:hypothetical protein